MKLIGEVGKPDLMVGAENGKVHAFRHDELFW